MKTFLTTGAALTAALVLFSCGAERSQPASQEGASTAKPEQAKPATAKAGREAGVFALDETAQSRIHLAIEPVREKNLAETISAPGDMDLDEGRVWRVGALVSTNPGSPA